MRIASFRMPSASSTLRPNQRSPISLPPPHFPLASRPNEQNAVDQFNLPSAFDLDAEVVGVVPPGISYRFADLKMHRFNRERSRAIYCPVEPKLSVATGIRARPASGLRNCQIGLDVDGVGRGLTPLGRCRDHDFQRRSWGQRQGWLDVNEVGVTGVTRKRKIIAVRKQRIECPKGLFGAAVAGRRVELDSHPWAPVHLGEGVASDRADSPGLDRLDADASGLVHHFEVKIEMISVTVQMDIEDVSPLVAGGIWKLYVRLCEIGIVAGNEQGLGKLVLRPRHPEGLLGDAAVIVEYPVVPNLHRQAVKGDEPPGPILVVRPAGVIGLSNIRTIADRHEALQVERELLPAGPQL